MAKKSLGHPRSPMVPTPTQALHTSIQGFEVGVSWETLVMQTPSGNNFKSKNQYATDRNAADTSEVSLETSAPLHPAGPGMAQTLHSLQIATLKASQTAMVCVAYPAPLFHT